MKTLTKKQLIGLLADISDDGLVDVCLSPEEMERIQRSREPIAASNGQSLYPVCLTNTAGVGETGITIVLSATGE